MPDSCTKTATSDPVPTVAAASCVPRAPDSQKGSDGTSGPPPHCWAGCTGGAALGPAVAETEAGVASGRPPAPDEQAATRAVNPTTAAGAIRAGPTITEC
jgi:hypothetical protein